MNGAQRLLEFFHAQGIDTLFGYPGGSIMPLYDALLDSPIRHVLCRHEQGAAFAANGYARASGRVGICLATSGPGATNLITGIADAHMDSVPLLAITGQVPSAMIGTDAFQEADVLGLSLPITKHSYLVRDISELPEVVAEAYALAQEGRPGPVLIDIPKDVFLAPCDPINAQPLEQPEPAPASALHQALELLAQAQRPLAYCGGGVPLAGATEALRSLIDSAQIPCVTTLKGIGAVPADHPLNLGMLGMHGTPTANRALQACDLLLCIGARFDDRATGRLAEFAPEAKVIHIDIDPAEVSKLRRADVALMGDMVSSLQQLTGPLDTGTWVSQCRRLAESPVDTREASGDTIQAPGFIRQLADAAGPDAVISCDVGQHQMWVAQHYPFSHPRNHLTSGGMGAMGFGLPAAIGAQQAFPDRRVINVAGDGSVMMNLQELATLGRYRLPVKIVVLDNQHLGMVRQQQELFFERRYSEVDLSDNPDFAQVAAAFGLPSFTCDHPSAVAEAIEQLLNTPGPALLHVKLNPQDNVWPIVPPGASNHQMIEETRP